MAQPSYNQSPPLAFGVASFVLGMIGFMLFFLPILGAPISVIGLGAGVVGCLVAGATSQEGSLRWSVAGVVLSCLARSGSTLASPMRPAATHPRPRDRPPIGAGPPRRFAARERMKT